MRKLIPMTQPEYDSYIVRLIPEYAADNVRAGYWSEAESLEKAHTQTESLLPQGLKTKDHYFYNLSDGDQTVGMIWLRVEPDRFVKSGFIFDVQVEEKFRGKGYGKEIMSLIEGKARELGIKRIRLHVFAYNTVARKLYEGIGYEISSLNMLKSLE